MITKFKANVITTAQLKEDLKQELVIIDIHVMVMDGGK